MHKTLKWAELETILRQGRIERIERIGRIESKNREKGKKSEIMVKKKKKRCPGMGRGTGLETVPGFGLRLQSIWRNLR